MTAAKTDTWVDEKGRKRRGPNPIASIPESFQVEKEAKASRPRTRTSNNKVGTKTATNPKETTVSPASKRGRRTGVTFNPPTITGTADSAPTRGRPSIYGPIIEQIVATSSESPDKWVMVNPEGRKAGGFRSAISAAARKMNPPVVLETSEGEVDGTMMVYVRVKPEG